jgi:hypothetical protein
MVVVRYLNKERHDFGSTEKLEYTTKYFNFTNYCSFRLNYRQKQFYERQRYLINTSDIRPDITAS